MLNVTSETEMWRFTSSCSSLEARKMEGCNTYTARLPKVFCWLHYDFDAEFSAKWRNHQDLWQRFIRYLGNAISTVFTKLTFIFLIHLLTLSLIERVDFWHRCVSNIGVFNLFTTGILKYDNQKGKRNQNLDIISNNAAFADALSDVEPHQHLSGHKSIPQSILKKRKGVIWFRRNSILRHINVPHLDCGLS